MMTQFIDKKMEQSDLTIWQNCWSQGLRVLRIGQLKLRSASWQKGGGPTEEKVSILLEPWFFKTFPVFPSNPGTFRRYSRWSYIARQSSVTVNSTPTNTARTMLHSNSHFITRTRVAQELENSELHILVSLKQMSSTCRYRMTSPIASTTSGTLTTCPPSRSHISHPLLTFFGGACQPCEILMVNSLGCQKQYILSFHWIKCNFKTTMHGLE